MKWIQCRLPKHYFLCYSVFLFLLFGLGLLFPSCSASAVTGSITHFYNGARTYWVNFAPGTMSSPVVAEPYDRDAEEAILLSGPNRAFSGYRFSASLPISTNDDYWTLVVKYSVRLAPSSWVYNSSLGSVSDYPVTMGIYGHRFTCSSSYSSSAGKLDITCNASGQRSEYIPNVIDLRFGDVDTFSAYWTSPNTGANNTNIFIISALTYDFNTTQDSSVALLEQQINIQQDQLSAQLDANDIALSQYEQDKQEESDREDSQSESADELAVLFSFSAINPFSELLALFGAGGTCVDIPTLSSWLHTEQTQVCPFFSYSVRNVITPVLGISSMMLLFGFFVRWLGGNGFNGHFDDSGGTD